MAKFKLYHVVDAVVPKVAMGDGTEAEWPKDYYHVAYVEVEATDEDEVFRLTNNTKDGTWAKNAGVKCFKENPRSTAPGDIVVFAGCVIRYMLGQNQLLS